MSNKYKIVLTFNEEWWQEKESRLKNIHLKKYATYNEAIKAFKSSEIDMILTTMYDWKEKFGFIGVNSYKFESSQCFFNNFQYSIRIKLILN